MPFDKINTYYGHILEVIMFSMPGKAYSVKFTILFKKVQFPLKLIALLWLKKGMFVVYEAVCLEDMEVQLMRMKDNENCSGESRIFEQ